MEDILSSPDQVIAILRGAAETEILPRFQNLGEDDIRRKINGEEVTDADEAAERLIADALTRLLAGSTVVGEEGAAADPAILERLSGPAPVWVIDPLDGTRNFVEGRAAFAVIVALVCRGKTQGGWILDVNSGQSVWAAAGEGAWTGTGEPLHAAGATEVDRMTGSLNQRRYERLIRTAAEKGAAIPEVVRYRCVGLEYMDLARRKLHFAFYGGALKPWDHAAGVLIHREAGGHSALMDGTPYNPIADIGGDGLLMAPDAAGWNLLHGLLKAV